MLGTAIVSSLVIGWFLGFVTYFSFKTGYKLLMEVLEDEKNIKKEPLAYSDQLD